METQNSALMWIHNIKFWFACSNKGFNTPTISLSPCYRLKSVLLDFSPKPIYPSTFSTNEMCQFFQLQSPFASCKMQDWFTELMQHFKIVYVKQSTQMRKYLSDSFSFCLFRSVCLLVRGLKTHLAVHCRLCCTG